MPFKVTHPLYPTWASMRNRCNNPNFRQWDAYGGRGIGICPEWDSFAQFAADMGAKPSPLYSLDRIDNDLGYSPENCRWATKKEQQRNQRRAVFVEIEGVRHRLVEIAEKTGIKRETITERAQAGMTLADIMAGVALPRRNKFTNATHCVKGHEFSPENTSVSKEGWRRCRACHRAKVARQIAAKKLKG